MIVARQFTAWNPCKKRDPSRRDGVIASLVPKVSLVECHRVLPQYRQIFLLECSGPMMCRLLLDVANRLRHLCDSAR